MKSKVIVERIKSIDIANLASWLVSAVILCVPAYIILLNVCKEANFVSMFFNWEHSLVFIGAMSMVSCAIESILFLLKNAGSLIDKLKNKKKKTSTEAEA